MNNPILEILSQGEEIVTGQIVDTNATWLAQQAVELGFNISRHTAVGDKLVDLVQVLSEISTRADCCICTGGLGPTSDDLTAEAVTQAFDQPLRFDETALEQIQAFFARRNRKMAECNRKQALLPQQAVRIDNQWGTAPGFAVQGGRCWFVFLPGVPAEMKPMFTQHVKMLIKGRFRLSPPHLITIKTVGIGESDLQERINAVAIPDEVQLGFRADVGEVNVKLLFPANYPIGRQTNLSNEVATKIGEAVYAMNDGESHDVDLVSLIDRLMTEKKLTLSVLETVGQGLLAAQMIGSQWLLESGYARSIELRMQSLALNYLPDNPLDNARQLATSLQKKTKSSLTLIQLYIEQPTSGTEQDGAAEIYTLLLVDGVFHHSRRLLAGTLKRQQQQATMLALDLLRRYLQDKSIV